MRRISHTGFSLVELLVSVAVLGVLASILVAVLGSARQRSDLVGSVSNVRSIGGAVQLFAADNNGTTPYWYNGDTDRYWWELLLPYSLGYEEYQEGGDYSIYHSPAHDEFDGTTKYTINQTISYGWNYLVGGRHVGDSSFKGDHALPTSLFPEPANTLILTDGPKYECWGYITHLRPGDPDRYGNNKLVSLFLDGHVQPLPYEDLSQEDPYFKVIKELPERK